MYIFYIYIKKISYYIYNFFFNRNTEIWCLGCYGCFLDVFNMEIHTDTGKFTLMYFAVAVLCGFLCMLDIQYAFTEYELL